MSTQPQLHFQVIGPSDFNEIFEFGSARLVEQYPDETERTFASWNVKWRREALEHYLKLGWSFVARSEQGETAGFFLAQPFIHFRGQTQTLWVELVEARDEQTRVALVDVAVRVAREKNLQRALFAEAPTLKSALEPWRPQPLEGTIAEVKTTKG